MGKEIVKGTAAADTSELLGRIGLLARQLREGMRALGLDEQVAMAAQAIPDARERLTYVAAMTERAAQRALNAIDIARPLQDGITGSAQDLSRRWDDWFREPVALDQARQLVADTRGFLGELPATGGAINAQLTEIMMAQDFQDLTGQVIKRMMDVIGELERGLLQVLIDNSPADKRTEPSGELKNGPQIKPDQPDAVTSQAQVDDLLASLGF